MDLGIIGPPQSGKTSLFNAVTRGSAQIGAYSSRQQPNVGVARVPDDRLERLAELFRPQKTTPAEIRWVDYPVAGFGPEGPGHRFIAELAGMDALVPVVRVFEDDAVPHPEGAVDPHRDLEALLLELSIADLALIETRLGRIEAEMRSLSAGERGRLERDRALLERVQAELEAGGALRTMELSEQERIDLTAYQFITRRPLLVVLNIGEGDIERTAEIEAEFAQRHGAGAGTAVAALSVKLEAELAMLEPDEAAEFRRDLGLPAGSPLDRAIREAYALLGLQSFFTVGEDECRAWPLPAAATAVAAAGKIHSDLERGFIRAEVCGWEELLEAGSLAELRRHGRLRTEGRDYRVADGEIVHILFNV